VVIKFMVLVLFVLISPAWGGELRWQVDGVGNVVSSRFECEQFCQWVVSLDDEVVLRVTGIPQERQEEAWQMLERLIPQMHLCEERELRFCSEGIWP